MDDEETRANALARRLANLDFSLESKVRQSLRNRLQSRSRWMAKWVRGLSYWTGFAVMMLIVLALFYNFQIPGALPGAEPQVTAYANTGSIAQFSLRNVEATLPMMPKPIQTPQAVRLPDLQSETMAPSLTISPFATPNITQKTGFH